MKSGIRYSLSEEQIEDIVDRSVKSAINGYREELKKASARKENENVRVTKRKLQAYRRVKASLKETEEFTDEEKIELRWEFVKDLMGSGFDAIEKVDDRIKSVEHKRKRDSFEIQIIDKAMQLYKIEAENSSSEEAKRRYRELYAMYIDEEGHTIEEIAEIESSSEKIVNRVLGFYPYIY